MRMYRLVISKAGGAVPELRLLSIVNDLSNLIITAIQSETFCLHGQLQR